MPSSTRDALVDAAVQLLDEGGPEAVTLREVGHRAGVSHNAPYKHFSGKEALLAAVAARELTRQATAVATATTTLRAVLHRYIGWALDHPARFRLVFGAWSVGSEELADAAETARAALIALVAGEQQAGRLPDGDPERLAALLQALAHGAVALTLAGHLSPAGKGHASPDDLVDDLIGYLAGGRRGQPT
jgi:AcrR family transcriptional regulator